MAFKALKLLLAGLALVAVFALLLFLVQDRLVYLPRRYNPSEMQRQQRDGLEPLAFRTDQGEQVAFYLPPRGGPRTPARVWLVFGGNGARSADYRTLAVDPGDGYLFVDYPGYGACEGRPSPDAIDRSVAAAIQALSGVLETPDGQLRPRLAVLGHSLGAAVALRAAADHGIERAVVVSPFTTAVAMARRVVGPLFAPLLRHRFDNVASLGRIAAANPDARVTIIHGLRDAEVPWQMGRELADGFPTITRWIEVPGGDHNAIVFTHEAVITKAMRGEKRPLP